jgi:hypothetical protein
VSIFVCSENTEISITPNIDGSERRKAEELIREKYSVIFRILNLLRTRSGGEAVTLSTHSPLQYSTASLLELSPVE